MKSSQRVLVVGATGKTGVATVKRLLAEGHQVTAFSRSKRGLDEVLDQIHHFHGDATELGDLNRAMPGHDAVIVTLGISENPLRVRLCGTTRTPMDVRSRGTRNVIKAMQLNKIERLVVQSSFGVGESRGALRFVDQLFFNLLLKPQIQDTEVQEDVVRQSQTDWVLAQPVHLTDGEEGGRAFVSPLGKVKEWRVSRHQVAQFLVEAIGGQEYVGKSVALSGQ